MPLHAHQLTQNAPGVSPYEPRVPGFNDSWWIDQFQNPIRADDRLFSFTDETGEEVARARLQVRPGSTNLWGTGVRVHRGAVEVVFLEVPAHLRRSPRRIGSKAVRMIEAAYPDVSLYAGPLQGAEGFWASTGWELFERPDRHVTSPQLFVLFQGVDAR